jgi:hypothetical protein
MGGETTTITVPTVVRTENEPQAVDGRIWINPSGGVNGNNTERYIYNADTTAWELDTSIGPDTPTKEIDGSLWQDSSVNPTTTRIYDSESNSWIKLGLELTTENVTVSLGNGITNGFTDIGLKNTYKKVVVSSQVYGAGGTDAGLVWMGIDNYNYDGSDNVTGMSVIWTNESSGNLNGIFWALGVEA